MTTRTDAVALRSSTVLGILGMWMPGFPMSPAQVMGLWLFLCTSGGHYSFGLYVRVLHEGQDVNTN